MSKIVGARALFGASFTSKCDLATHGKYKSQAYAECALLATNYFLLQGLYRRILEHAHIFFTFHEVI